MKQFSWFCLLVLAPCFVAKANIIPNSTTITGTGPYTWSYDVRLSADQNINSGIAPFSNPVPHSNLTVAGFFTIYDFAGYMNGSCGGPAGWTCTAQYAGSTPDDVTPIDSPNFVNITWSYTTGPSLLGQPSGSDLGTFSAQSSFNLVAPVSYAARGFANTGPQTGTVSDNVGQTQAPTDAPLLPSCSLPQQFSGTGSTGANTALVAFETAVGGANNGSGPPAANGFRAINWDAVVFDGTDFSGNTTTIVPNKVVGIPVNRFQSRGVMFDRVHAVANDGFLSTNPTVQFPAFSASNIFAPYNKNVVTVSFVTPSAPPAAPTPAYTRAFGAIFLDVEVANTTSIEYFSGTTSLGKFFAPPGASTQPVFLGVLFGGPSVTSAVITLGTAQLFNFNGTTYSAGPGDSPPTSDQVALDDFAYAEPAAATFTVNAVKGSPISGVLATFKDTGGTDLASSFAVSINWGDGTTTIGTVTGSSSCFSLSGTHAYTVSGNFPVLITINDIGGAVGVVNGTASVMSIASGDFNGDGKKDVLLRDSTGTIGMWLMNGSTILSGAAVGSPGGTYTVAGIGDFDGDGKSDILLRDNLGNLGMWFMNGPVITSGAAVGSPGGSYVVAAVADFNGDGKADILLRDNLGNLGMWIMNGATIASGGFVGSPGGSYAVADAADFNGDGKADILLRDSTGALGMWIMNGVTITTGALVGSPGGSYNVASVGDFNGDGKADILLRDSLGNLGVWIMNGAAITSGASVGSPGGFSVAATGDFNGDAHADILLRNSSTGDVGMWLMNGAVITSGASVGPLAATYAIIP